MKSLKDELTLIKLCKQNNTRAQLKLMTSIVMLCFEIVKQRK